LSKRKLGLAAVIASAAVAVAPAPSHAAPDLGETCASLIGNNAGNIDLSPLVNVGYKTCQLADTRGGG
jgi:hypothetical protein